MTLSWSFIHSADVTRLTWIRILTSETWMKPCWRSSAAVAHRRLVSWFIDCASSQTLGVRVASHLFYIDLFIHQVGPESRNIYWRIEMFTSTMRNKSKKNLWYKITAFLPFQKSATVETCGLSIIKVLSGTSTQRWQVSTSTCAKRFEENNLNSWNLFVAEIVDLCSSPRGS